MQHWVMTRQIWTHPIIWSYEKIMSDFQLIYLCDVISSELWLATILSNNSGESGRVHRDVHINIHGYKFIFPQIHAQPNTNSKYLASTNLPQFEGILQSEKKKMSLDNGNRLLVLSYPYGECNILFHWNISCPWILNLAKFKNKNLANSTENNKKSLLQHKHRGFCFTVDFCLGKGQTEPKRKSVRKKKKNYPNIVTKFWIWSQYWVHNVPHGFFLLHCRCES